MQSLVGRGSPSGGASNIEDWLISYIADLMEVSPSRVQSNKSFSWLGLDSVSMAVMAGDLSDWIGREIDVSVVYEYRTIASLSQYLSGLLREAATA